MSDWTQPYARALGIKWSPTVAARLQQWQRWEGGSTNNSARNNYMNTKMPMPGSWDAIGNGVQGYKTLAQGAQAFASTLKARPDYAPLVQWLGSGMGDPTHALGVWVNGPGGADAPNAKEYAQKVLGHVTHGGMTTDKTGVPVEPVQTPSILSAPSMSDVRSQAANGFAEIAQGQARPEDTFGPLLDTLKRVQPSATPAPSPSTVQSDTGKIPVNSKLETQATNLVKKYLGIKYTWGGEDPKTGFDCSGLVQYVWKTLGVNVPRTSQQQYTHGKAVMGDLKPGDAVFFVGSDGTQQAPGHEGMYIGNGLFIEAPHTGAQVRVSKLSGRHDYVGARRFA